MKIGKISRKTGLTSSAIRFYEQEGLLPKSSRTGGKRDFDEAAITSLNFIKLAKEAGFSLKEVKTLLREFQDGVPPSKTWNKIAHQKLRELDITIERTKQMQSILRNGMKCGCLALSSCELLTERASRIQDK